MKKLLIVAAMAIAPAAAFATNLTGTWKIDSSVGTTPLVVDCKLLQQGEALTGQCAPRNPGVAPADVRGSVKGTKAQWGYGVLSRGNQGRVAFEAEITSASNLTGTMVLDGKPNAFKASRVGGPGKPSLEARLQALQDEAEIRTLLQDYMALLTDRDWDNYIAFFTTDAELVMTEGTVRGRDAIRTRMANATERMAKAAAAAARPQRRRADLLTNINVKVMGNSATASSRFTFIGENDAHQFMVTGSGLYLDLLAREDGRWRIKQRTVDYDLLAGQAAAPAPTTPAPAARP
jgi:3-phenylpropionate/cinnamic acid dioxygenase small subunit